MKRESLHNNKKGFTLTELLISMTLLALVGAAVLLFVTAMASFSAGNSDVIKQLAQGAELREEIDFWFSAMDSEGYTIELNKGDYVARASSPDGSQYYIRWRYDLKKDGVAIGTLQFLYPTEVLVGNGDGTNLVEKDGSHIRSIYFAKQDDELNGSLPSISENVSDEELVFPIRTHVIPANYLCKIVLIQE